MPLKSYYAMSTSRPFPSLDFFTPDTSDVIPAASSSPETFWQFSAVCLTVFLFEFWPRTFTFKLFEERPSRLEIVTLDFLFTNTGRPKTISTFRLEASSGREASLPDKAFGRNVVEIDFGLPVFVNKMSSFSPANDFGLQFSFNWHCQEY